ncbi:amino acid adenylation domain-containing protein [Clostridium sp. CF011]|uniref:non-ribosomal peptide synthetase n=1 Tax=Clostridium sp. CF011 TaxID=2843318 RepID=UPI001C0C1A94|nr:non-ribosomal peptide synthetase [Clostridium sp. CF011]MBU3093333.1 amino acid adenylation domain-containing protein [Clostridium sp. CF011]WAG70789.1 amino acid adenylation domain-containing protein [Clostridium sp. CF011]
MSLIFRIKASSAQKRLFTLNQFEKEKTSYNMPSVMVVEGNLEKEKVEETFRKLVERHEAFRTSFELRDKEIVQKIHKEVEFYLEYIELKKEEEETIKIIVKSFIKPFDLSKAPLLRVKLIKIEEEKHILMIDMHHIISDGTSIGIIIEEFSKLYKGEELKKLKIQYKDYSAWQNEALSSENMKNQEEYWKNVFKKKIPVLDMPTDYKRPTMKSFEGESIGFKIDKYITEKAKKIGMDNGTTLYMTLLSTYNILLSRYSGQEDIIVGSPIEGRPHADLQKIVGVFVNTLAMRNYPKADKTFKDFLQDVKKNALNAYENQDYQFDELVKKLDIRKDLSRNALFDAMFVLQNTDVYGIDIDSLKFKPYSFEYKMSKFDITLSAIEAKGEISFNIEYCTKLFKRETIERVIQHFINILKEVSENPEIKISEIEMISEEEKIKILVDFNNTKAEYQKDKTIYELFEEQVEKTPDNIAVVFEDEKLTYRELNEKANCLARILREKGVKPDSVVGIMIESSPEMIVGILAILKAGGAYLPIEPSYPQERIKYILENSKSSILITKSAYMDLFNIEVEIIDIDNTEIYNTDKENLGKVNIPQDLAYIIYTSGSTGKPKGVVITHEAVLNTIQDINSKFAVKENDKIIGLSSVCFDLSVYDIFGALSTGAKLVQIKDQRDVNKIIEVLKDKSITIWNSVPAIMDMLIESITEPFKNENLRLVMLSGDWIPLKLPGKIKKYFPNAAIISLGGATEASIWSIYYPVTEVKIGWNSIPYGMPLSNQSFYVLNKEMKLCPFGIPGKLYIGGIGLAKGYMNDIEKTKNAFINHPEFGKLYSTGDWGRFRKEGYIEFLGRRDHQVKIRGFRIELGEIENQLLRQENIKEAVVVDREDKKGNKYLCAYIVLKKEMTVAELRESLSKELPDYMIPAYFIQIEKIPLTPNGKIDRKALPEPDGEISTGVEYAVPRNEIEEKMVKVWSEVLGVKKVGIDDSFFELGGDSIKAIRMISKLREYGYEIGIRNIMRDRTIRAIRTGISKVEISNAEQSEIVGKVGLTPIQIDIFTNKLEVPNHFNQSFILESKERIKQESLKKALTAIVEHHDILRAVYKDDELTIRSNSEGSLYNFKYYDFSDIKEEEILYRKIDESANEIQSSINISTGPLMKVGVFCTEYKDYLFISIHHLVVDGVSWRIILEDLSRGYLASKEKKEIILPAKTVSFKKWSETLRRYRESNDLKKEIVYWKDIEQKVKESKMGFTVNDVEHGINDVIVHLTSEQTNDLLYKAGRAYGTEINDLLLTALFRAVNKVTGIKSVSVSVEGHGREPIGFSMAIDRTVGWFTSVYPVAINEIGETIVKDICKIKETLRKIPNHGIGYGVLKVLGDDVLEGIEPDITFNYLGEFGQENNTEDFLLSNISCGQEISEKNRFGTPISVNGAIINKELNLIINFDKERFSKCFIEDFKRQYEKQLLDIIGHCVKVRKRESIEVNGLEMNNSYNNFDMNQFIWSRFSVDSILKVISVDKQAYSILFVENMDQKIRNEIINTITEKLSIKHMPHYCINMRKHQLSQSIMDEKMFREMCSDNNSLSNKDFSQIELKNFNNNLNNKIIDQYIASCMQKSFLEATGTIIEEVITINGIYSQDKIMEAVKLVVQEQSVLRSSYEKCDREYIISEHKYDTSWYVPYVDLRYSSYEYITTIHKDIYGMKNGEGNCDGRNNLIRMVITRESEVCHKLHIIAHHSGWDKASTQILNDRLNDLIKSDSTETLIKTTYKNYIEEIKNCNGFTKNIGYMAELKIEDFIENVNEYVRGNIDNNLEKSILLTIKMGPKSLKVLKEKPWNLLTHVLRIVARENQLISLDKTIIPMFILQEDRRGKERNYTNTMGEFLDILPILIDCSQDAIKCDMQKYVEKVQNIKKDENINYLELFNRQQQDFYLLTASVLSINYHGIFELTYDIVQKMLSLDKIRRATEIFVNCYSNYLVISFPIYKKCINNLEKILQDEFNILETKFSEG